MPNSVSLSYPEIWAKTMVKNFDGESVMVHLVNRSVEAALAQGGDVVHVQRFGNVTVSDYTAGTDFAPSTVSLTDATLTLDQQKAFHFIIDKIESKLATSDLIKGFTHRAMVSMAQTIDSHLLARASDVNSGNIIGSSLNPILLTQDNVYEYFVEAGRMLDEDNIPAEGRVAVIDPTTKAMILRSPDFIKATQTGDRVVRKGEIGELAGFRVVVSNRIPTVAGVKDLMFFTPDFISLAMRIPPDAFETYKPEKQFGTGVKGLALYGSKVFHDTACVVLKKSAS